MVGIFGSGRNGSTLLMRLLDGSPGLWVYPLELNYLSVFRPRSFRGMAKRMVEKLVVGRAFRKQWSARHAWSFMRWASCQVQELNKTYVKQLEAPLAIVGDPMERIRRGIGQSLQEDLGTFLEAIRLAYDDRQSTNGLLHVFKSIEVAELACYHRLFPAMRFIHIIRHPASNYASLKRTDMVRKQKPFWFQGGDILRTQLEARWIPHARFILAQREQGCARHFVVTYEELCEQPAAVVQDICRWLEVPPPPDPELQTVLGGKHMRELPMNPSQNGVRTPVRVVRDMTNEFAYEDVLTDREKELILARTYSLARRLGYFLPNDAAKLPSRLKLGAKWFWPDRWELMNSDSSIRLVHALLARRCYIYGKLLLPFS